MHSSQLFDFWRSSASLIILVVCGLWAKAEPPNFSVDVMSVLSKAGCNAGTCHGNLNGKGGFKLSLRGQDPEFDYRSLVMSSRGRRVNFSRPNESLFLRKASGQVAHRGGVRFDSDSPEYKLLRHWLQDGGRSPSPSTPHVTRLQVLPASAIVAAPEDQLQVRVTAHFSDGTSREVTSRACYELSNLRGTVDAAGRVTRNRFGETTLIVRYLQAQVPLPIAFIEEHPNFRWTEPSENSEIDQLVFGKLERLRINPSTLCSDSEFVRRAHLDAIGRLPTADEAKEFVRDQRPQKRRLLIERLLARTEFADFWALKWADVLRTEEKVLDTKGVERFHGWIKQSISSGQSLDAFVRLLVTGTGNTFEQPAANYYRANRDPATRGETTARLFLGTRLQCAKCHNHPFDRWTQDDYYRWSAMFSQIDYDLGDNPRKDKLDKNEFAGEQTVLIAKMDEVRNPTTGLEVLPKLLGARELTVAERADRLSSLASWLTSPDNELFARSQANFIWYHLMGRGIVDPIDDFRLTNPPSNPPLLDHLAHLLVQSRFDLRSIIRSIMNSRTYQLSSKPNETNRNDVASYSRAYIRRLPAEVILDMQSDLLEMPAEFAGYAAGIRAVQIPGVQKMRARDATPKPGDRFLKTFGKPERILACDCERSSETTLKQVFVLLGDSTRLASPQNRLRRLAVGQLSNSDLISELYWAALSRAPNEAEFAAANALLVDAAPNRAEAVEDIAWALMNAKEFLFRR